MSIRNAISIKWDGVGYNITVTMGVIDNIESAGVNLFDMAHANATGSIQPVQLAKLLCALLVEGGAIKTVKRKDPITKRPKNVDIPLPVDDVFNALFGSGELSRVDIQPMVNAIFSAIFPEPKKKSITPSPKPTRKRGKKKT